MKVPLSWLRDYVDITLPVPQLVERLTLAGLEVAGVRMIGLPPPEGLRSKAEAGPVWDRDKIVIAQVVAVEPHPNADRLTLPTVDLGGGRTKQLVTGAPNIKVGDRGQKVVVALQGSVLYDGHSTEKVLKELKPAKVRGFLSDAMVCSERELGISDEHEGILILEDDAPVGMPAADFMGDVVLDLDVLPNMARALSMIGVAREVAALTGQPLLLPPHAMQALGEPIRGQVEVVIDDPKLSARYAAALIRGVTTGPAPGWMRRRLTAAGMRPISNLVDVTNYVMLEWGQPLHAFDYDALRERAGGKAPVITVRAARKGERLKTLDGVDRELSPENLVIADARGPVAIAGVMGGADTEVSAGTTNVLLESANFDFVSVRRTMRALDLPSEASVRFSKGIHPETVRPAAERAAELMRQHAGGTVSKGLVDCYPAPLPEQVITLEMREVRRQLGIDFPAAEAERILRALEFKVEPIGPEALRVTTPPHRRDIQEGPADLIEDLVRIHGHDRLPSTLLADELPEQHTNHALQFEERVRDLLADLGLQEVITYSLTTPEREAPLSPPGGEYVRLLNPISAERSVMRHTVLAGVLEVAAANLRHTADVRLFEVGPVYLPRPGERLPDEPVRLALALAGRRWPEFWDESARGPAPVLDFFDLKGVMEGLTA
ncbi:MAG TPA: phenylalanine--tRNA ligase subunit beta, partial [Gemmataceae bacterium]|nr:phenylalanine--tRNA ligase subunit beta [Gemmataceae bacterium]